MQLPYKGAIEDPRSPEQKAKDWSHEELFGSGIAKFNPESSIPFTTKRNQDGSTECGGFSCAKALGLNNFYDVGEYKDLNPDFIYKHRINVTAGMFLENLLDLGRTVGAPEDKELICDNKSQVELDKLEYSDAQRQEALKYKGKNYAFIPVTEFEQIAEAINNKLTPIFLFSSGINEWNRDIPIVDTNNKNFEVSHFVPLIAAVSKDNINYIVCDDSCLNENKPNGHRFLTKEFIATRGRGIGYIIDLPNLPNPDKPSHKFTTPLTYGMKNNADVKALQDILKYEGFMDKDIPSTGNYLNITANAVYKYQVAHAVAPQAVLDTLKGVNSRVGILTVLSLNKD